MMITVACGCGALTLVAESGAQLPPTISCGECGRAIGTFAAPPGGAGLPLALQDLRVFDDLVADLRTSLEREEGLSPSVRQTLQDIADRAQRSRDALRISLDDIAKAHSMLVQLWALKLKL